MRRNKPPEGSTSEFFFFLLNCMYTIYKSPLGPSLLVDLPLQDLNERALNQPRPHPSDKTV